MAEDLVLFGKQATDGDTAQVGPGVAYHLGLPVLTYAKSVEPAGDKALKVVRATEDGHEEWEVALPCALTVVKEAGELRIGSLKSKMAAKKALQASGKFIPWQVVTISRDGRILD